MLNDGEKGVVIQRDKQTYAVAPHLPCGVVTPDQLRTIAAVAEKYHAQALKITSAERIAIVGIQEQDIDAVWNDLGMSQAHMVGMCVRSVKVCPGTTFCKRAQQDSLAVGMLWDEKYHGLSTPGKLKFGVSGCPNQCAETCIKDIGLVGTAKGWRLYAGGCGGTMPRLAELVADGLSTEEAIAMADRVIEWYKSHVKAKERLSKVLGREGLDSLKQFLGLPI
ncbi:MAG: hypothetical protein PHE53_12220 [Thermoguttaceae bacterium]|nr:hypothetical protein [Thermoguttaceae bacterium]